MGRKRQGNFDDPPRFHKKGKVWYHVSGTLPRVWTKLSSDRAEALRMWAQREGGREDDSTKLFSISVKRLRPGGLSHQSSPHPSRQRFNPAHAHPGVP
jgi:hypothetical protein